MGPDKVPRRSARSVTASDTSCKIRLARSRKAAPSSVTDILRVVRWSSVAPRLRSSSASRSLTTDFDSRSVRAASLIERASATATKLVIPSSFIVRTSRKIDQSKPSGKDSNDDQIPPLRTTAVPRLGDVWLLGRHRLLCSDARESPSYAMLMGDERVELMFTDPPYNVPIMGHVCGLGRARHREFAMAAGEMTPTQFTGFLTSTQWRRVLCQRRDRLRLHRLAPYRRTPQGRSHGVQQTQKHLRLEQDKWWHGHVLPLKIRIFLRFQDQRCPSPQYIRSWRYRTVPNKCLGLSQCKFSPCGALIRS